MNKLNNATLRSALSIVLGFVLVLWPEMAVNYLVITIGILFILPGIFSLLSYFTRDKSEEMPPASFPIEAAGSILFGAWLVIMPTFFVNILMYILGALLVLAGIFQIIHLFKARKWSLVPWGFYILPIVILITGIVILFYPFATVATTFMIFGAALIIYGFTELINTYRFRKKTGIVVKDDPEDDW